MAIQVAVCGPSQCTNSEAATAFRAGELLAERGAIVLCGGYGGVMGAVAAGARSRDGLVIGILSGPDRASSSPDLTATIVTNMGEARNAIIARSADAVIVVGGSWGTLSEIALACRGGKAPVVCIGGWQVLDAAGSPLPGLLTALDADAAVRLALGDRTGR